MAKPEITVNVHGPQQASIAPKSLVELTENVNTLTEEVNSLINPETFSDTILTVVGDSLSTEPYMNDARNAHSWPYYINEKLHFKAKNNMAQGGATVKDRTSNTSGTTKHSQWRPDVGDAWIEYWGISSWYLNPPYQSGTPEYDQAYANNCLYSQIGNYKYHVDHGDMEAPDIFIIGMEGFNDVVTENQTTATSRGMDYVPVEADINATNVIIGTIDDAFSENWESLARTTVLRGIRWAVMYIRKTWPNCKLILKTTSQFSPDSGRRCSYLLEEPLRELLRRLSVPVIDSYGELGVNREFESRYITPETNIWTFDGMHLTDNGQKRDAELVVNKLINMYSQKL